MQLGKFRVVPAQFTFTASAMVQAAYFAHNDALNKRAQSSLQSPFISVDVFLYGSSDGQIRNNCCYCSLRGGACLFIYFRDMAHRNNRGGNRNSDYVRVQILLRRDRYSSHWIPSKSVLDALFRTFPPIRSMCNAAIRFSTVSLFAVLELMMFQIQPFDGRAIQGTLRKLFARSSFLYLLYLDAMSPEGKDEEEDEGEEEEGEQDEGEQEEEEEVESSEWSETTSNLSSTQNSAILCTPPPPPNVPSSPTHSNSIHLPELQWARKPRLRLPAFKAPPSPAHPSN